MFNFRKFIFTLRDKISGGIISKYLHDIDYIYNNPENPKAIIEITNRQKKLFEHSVLYVSYYRNYLSTSKEFSLTSFPVINKNIIRDNIDNFISDGINKNELNMVVTSGSTGTPFSVYHDRNKKLRNTADAIFFGKLAGFNIGVRLNYLKIWTKINRKNKIQSWLQNIVPIDVTQMSDFEIEKLVSKFKTNEKSIAFLGYASALESICKYLDKKAPETKIKKVTSIIAMSEGISQSAKTILFKYFGKHPVSRYSNVENGIIAQQLPDGSNDFYINWASYYVEILDLNNDSTVSLGSLGRIVVTDYYNYAMPIIRYDTGDIGSLNWDRSGKKIVLSNIEGRKMDMVFNTTGNLISSFTLTNNMWLYPEIKQYQFIQLDKKSYLFKLNLEGNFEREEFLISEFKKYFGKDASISIEYVNEIPLLSSGKRKKVVNEWKIL